MPANAKLGSGTTVVVFDAPAVASVDVRGGGPGTRETALLDPAQTVEGIDAIVLSGGSAFGLDAASGVQAYLREQGRGFQVRETRVPIVPGAILFDLLNGGDKNWGRYPPYREFGYEAAKLAGAEFALGSAGAGLGATTANLKGGVGSASARNARRHHGRRAGGGQCRRHDGGRRRPAFLGGGVRTERRIRRPRRADQSDARRPCDPRQRRRARKHHACRDRHRREAQQGAVQSPCRHGAETASPAPSIRCTPRSMATWCSRPPIGAKPLADPYYSVSPNSAWSPPT